MLLSLRLSASGAAWFFVNEKHQNVGGILRTGPTGEESEQIALRMVELWNADQKAKGNHD